MPVDRGKGMCKELMFLGQKKMYRAGAFLVFLQNNYSPVSVTIEIEFQVDFSPSSRVLHSALLCLPCVCKEKESHMEAEGVSYCSLCLK